MMLGDVAEQESSFISLEIRASDLVAANGRSVLYGKSQMKRFFVYVILTIAILGCQKNNTVSCSKNLKDVTEIIGATHVKGGYYFTNKDFLNEGADQLLNMKMKVVKVWFYNGREASEVVYPYNSQWKKVDSLVEGAKSPYWKAFFDKPFKTFIMNVMALNMPDYYWLHGITEQQAAEEKRQFYELAKYFLMQYKDTGKTFIFANHEGDWHIKDRAEPNAITPPERFSCMIKWLQARQDGVEQAREEIGMHGVRVFHATEVVNVVKTMKDKQDNIVNKVLPFVTLDLVSYSAYDSTVYGRVHDRQDLKAALDFIAAHARKSPYFGKKNVFIGEYGIPENEFSQKDIQTLVPNVVETGLEWGCPYIVYWELYCNEPKPNVKVPDWNNNDFRGFWLIRPDGSKEWAYEYFVELLKKSK